jgi:flagellar biogenesis protein FliO
MALLLCLMASVPAQEGSPPEQPTAVSSPQPQKPRTVGEALFPEPTAKVESTTEEVPTASELNFPEKKELGKEWATEGKVGRSTFFDKLIEVCWFLAIICLLVWVAGKVAARFGFKNLNPGGSTDSMIEILEKKRLSPGRTVMLMRVGPKVLAVAATEGGYETLTEFTLEEFNQYKDSKVTKLPVDGEKSVPEGATTPGDIARHYLSIIPGTGAKK